MSNCKVIALTNQKGGVGKTTTAVNLGVSLVQQGKKVLLIDADAQANLTMALGYNRPDDIPITLSTVMQNIIDDKTLDVSQGIIHHSEGVDLLPSNIEMSGFEVRLINAMSRERVLKTYVNEVKKNYDYVLIDCMPSLGMITINALAAADSVIIPTQPHYLSAKGLELLLRSVSMVKRQINPKLRILVYKLSRFGRNAADILNSLEFVQSYGINLICIEEGIDSSQTSGKLLISVLSAVAEIERENIIEQTMNGRREKARQGGWNGGFAPYGYYLKDNQLLIEETEAEAIRIIFDKFANSDIGLGGVAKYLNLQGIKKIPRQNGTLETWSSHFIRLILDNPVYCGKIAYGRRTREKVKGTKNEYKQVHAEDYILEDGQHEGIISEELWQKVHAKRMATGIKQPSKIGKDRSHLLTGILKCPLCGSSMYTNKHAWTNKDGTYKEVYYYICGRNKQERGHHCDYKASLRKTDIEPLVIEAVKELVSDKYFAKEIEKRIGVQTDTTAIDKELANYESKLKEVDLNKARLEREIDNLPVDTRFRERKIHDMTLRLDALYDTIVELEERIEDAKLRKSSIEMETITLDNIYKLMLNFGKLYDIISDEEKKSLITYLIKEIQIYPNGESEQPLKSIEFNFPIYRDGQEVRRLLWEKGNTVECVVLMSRKDKQVPENGVFPGFFGSLDLTPDS